MPIPTPVEFWTLNNTRVGAVAGTTLVSGDGNDYFADPGKIGQGWNFDKNTKRTLSNLFAFDLTAAWTISVWVKRKDTTNVSAYCVSVGPSIVRVDDEQSAFSRNARVYFGSTSKVSKSLAKDTNWHHFCAVYNPASGGSLNLYVDGVKASAASVGAPSGTVTAIAVSGAFAINGLADCVGIWSVALSDSEAAELYNAGAGWEYTPADNTPDAFSFAAVTDAALSTQYVSDPAEVTGMDAGTAVSIANGEYRVNGGAWTSDAGTIDPGDTLELRGTSSADPETETIVAVTVGTLTVNWSITTAAAQTLKQHLIVGPTGLIQPVGACVIVPGWV